MRSVLFWLQMLGPGVLVLLAINFVIGFWPLDVDVVPAGGSALRMLACGSPWAPRLQEAEQVARTIPGLRRGDGVELCFEVLRPRQALVEGVSVAGLVAGGLSVVAGAIRLIFLRRRPPGRRGPSVDRRPVRRRLVPQVSVASLRRARGPGQQLKEPPV